MNSILGIVLMIVGYMILSGDKGRSRTTMSTHRQIGDSMTSELEELSKLEQKLREEVQR